MFHRADEALHVVFVLRELRPEHLERDLAIVLEIVGLEDEPRLPLGDDGSDFIVR